MAKINVQKYIGLGDKPMWKVSVGRGSHYRRLGDFTTEAEAKAVALAEAAKLTMRDEQAKREANAMTDCPYKRGDAVIAATRPGNPLPGVPNGVRGIVTDYRPPLGARPPLIRVEFGIYGVVACNPEDIRRFREQGK